MSIHAVLLPAASATCTHTSLSEFNALLHVGFHLTAKTDTTTLSGLGSAMLHVRLHLSVKLDVSE